MRTLQLGNLQAGKGQPAFIIAEIGINHQGNVNIARELVKTAKDCGAHAVKLQKRSISRILTKEGLEMPLIFQSAHQLQLKCSPLRGLELGSPQ